MRGSFLRGKFIAWESGDSCTGTHKIYPAHTQCNLRLCSPPPRTPPQSWLARERDRWNSPCTSSSRARTGLPSSSLLLLLLHAYRFIMDGLAEREGGSSYTHTHTERGGIPASVCVCGTSAPSSPPPPFSRRGPYTTTTQ